MKRVLVVGDAISDVYRAFNYRKQCPDSPKTPVGIESGCVVRAGGAANVALNLVALSHQGYLVDFVSVMDDDCARVVKRHSRNLINLYYTLVVSPDESIRKERILLDGNMIARLDNRTTIDSSNAIGIEEILQEYLRNNRPDLIVLSDYNCGVLTDRVIELLRPHFDRLIIDTKRVDLSVFSGSLLVKLNAQEYGRVLETEGIPEQYFRFFVVTRGALGARLIIRNEMEGNTTVVNTINIRAQPVDAVDVCGCGDTFLAGIAAGLLRFDDPFEAISFANAAAATVVTQPKTAIADLDKALEMIGRKEK